MDTQTIDRLCALTQDFYQTQGKSFSATRAAAWRGWDRCLAEMGLARGEAGDGEGHVLGGAGTTAGHTRTVAGEAAQDKAAPAQDAPTPCQLSVFDLACGNLRFERYLTAALPLTKLTLYTVDSCDDLIPDTPPVDYQSLDVLAVLRAGGSIDERIAAPVCDLSVAFGFLHHVPTQAYRIEVLKSLVRQTRPGGYAVVSFWQFADSGTLRTKAVAAHGQAVAEHGIEGLDPGDFLLGWQGIPGAYRYCHSFSVHEIDELVAEVKAAGVAGAIPATAPQARFTADGRNGRLNTYVVLRLAD